MFLILHARQRERKRERGREERGEGKNTYVRTAKFRVMSAHARRNSEVHSFPGGLKIRRRQRRRYDASIVMLGRKIAAGNETLENESVILLGAAGCQLTWPS